MRRKIFKTLGFILAVIAVSSVANPFLAHHTKRYDPVDFGKIYEYSGVIGIHTTFSDGTRSYAEVERICDAHNLHFAITTDVNTLKPLKSGFDKRFGMTLMIPAVQMSGDRGRERYLVIGDSIPQLPGKGIGLDSVLADARRKGSLVILDRSGSREAAEGHEKFVTGMELYNFNENWKDMFSLTGINKLIGSYLGYTVNEYSLNYLIEYPEKRMDEFDRLNMKRRVVGLGVAGAGSYDILGWRKDYYFPSYQGVMGMVHTVIVTRTAYNATYEHDRGVTLDALRSGHAYVSFPGLEPARGFFFTASSGDSVVMMGDSLRLTGKATLSIQLPDSSGVETQVLRNGKVIGSYHNVGSVGIAVSTPGEYRVQVFQRRMMLPFFMSRAYPWILSNPIYIYSR